MIIYVIKNIKNGKCYVGQTIRSLKERKWDYMSRLKRNVQTNPYLQNAWNKYGKENFKFEVLEKCDSLKELNKCEKYWIEKCGDYNLRSGGKNYRHSPETKQKMKKVKNNKKDQLRKIHAESRGIKVKQLDKENNVINSYCSIMEASRQTDTHEYSIRRVLNPDKSNCKTAGGYKWEKA